jgi:hypothetical protein
MDAISLTEIFRATSAATDVGLHEWVATFWRASGLAVLALLLVRALRRFAGALAVGRRRFVMRRAAVIAHAARSRRPHAARARRPIARNYQQWIASLDRRLDAAVRAGGLVCATATNAG